MPSVGPSKEELEYYYKNSRKYFDELAKHYYEADRAYYDKFIAPYYSSFGSALSGGSRGSGPARSLAVVAALVVLALGFAVFLIMQGVQNTDIDNRKSTEDVRKNTQEESAPAADTTTAKSKESSDYTKGLEYFNKQDYDNAEKYFKRVPKDDDNYYDAQRRLKVIGPLKKDDFEKNRDRYVKPKPRERIR